MKNNLSSLRGSFFSLLELLLVLAIILFLSQRFLNMYFKKPNLDKETEEAISGQGINTSSYRGVLDSTRDKIRDINKQLINRQ
jgi:hypothetical protein